MIPVPVVWAVLEGVWPQEPVQDMGMVVVDLLGLHLGWAWLVLEVVGSMNTEMQ